MHLTEEQFSKLTKLCRIECSQEEKSKLLENISKIISYVDLLAEINTQDVAPCNQVIKSMSNVMREDVIQDTLSREEFLSNAPSHIGGMVRVPPILKSSN